MSYEFLQILWFILIAVLWIGFFFLEGFDFGVGMLLPFLGKKDEERRRHGVKPSAASFNFLTGKSVSLALHQ